MLNNKSIVILGMHRSGTSALAGVFNLLGIPLGSSLISPVAGVNEKGFWEHADLVEINDRLLEAIGSCWHDISSLPDNWWAVPTLRLAHHLIRRRYPPNP